MTWEEWVNSNYNTFGNTQYGYGCIWVQGNSIVLDVDGLGMWYLGSTTDGNNVYKTDEIVSTTYTITQYYGPSIC